MASTADFKTGLCLNFKNDLFTIVDFQHVKPGKGPAFVRSKLKSLTTGRVIENTFTAGEKVDTARIETRPHQYLFKEESGYTFMDSENFEQVTIPSKLVSGFEFMKEGQEVTILFHAETEKALSCELPPFVPLQVTYTEPAVKGNTSSNAMKSATLETGAVINVPMFIEQDEWIRVDTRDGTYYERVK
ncbi:MAG: elongation factor P [Opitutaceae bacterium]|nr:elongation factor P [Cytophagales bacterium]